MFERIKEKGNMEQSAVVEGFPPTLLLQQFILTYWSKCHRHIVYHLVETQYTQQQHAVAEHFNTALQSFHLSRLNGILFFGMETMDTASVRQICSVNWEKHEVKAQSLEDVAVLMQHSAVLMAQRPGGLSAFVNTAILTFLCERGQKPLSVTSSRDTLWSCFIEN